MTTDLAQLYSLGERIDATLTAGKLGEVQVLMDSYLVGLEVQFRDLEPHSMSALEGEQRQLLQQFQTLLARVEREKNQTESELRGLSKAGRASELYKKNAG